MFEIFKKLGRKPAKKEGEEKKKKAPATKKKTTSKKKASPKKAETAPKTCLLYTSPSPRDGLLSRMPSSA